MFSTACDSAFIPPMLQSGGLSVLSLVGETEESRQIQGEVLAHVYAVAVNVTIAYGIDCLACQDVFFVNNRFDIKENDKLALDFAFRLSRLFRSR
jgi:hypothetical protein